MSLEMGGVSIKILGFNVKADTMTFSAIGLALVIGAFLIYALMEKWWQGTTEHKTKTTSGQDASPTQDAKSADNSARSVTSIFIIILMYPVKLCTSACHATKNLFVHRETLNPGDEVIRELKTKLPRFYKS